MGKNGPTQFLGLLKYHLICLVVGLGQIIYMYS